MLNLFVSLLLCFGVSSNIVLLNGSGSLLFQKEKQYTKFRILDSLFVSIGAAVCLIATHLLYSYVYKTYNLESLSILVSVLIVGIWNLIVSKIFSKMSHFNHYLYEKSNSFALDFVYILSIIFIIDMSAYNMIEMFIVAGVVLIVTFVTNIVFGFFIEDSNKSTINNNYLNVPARLFMLAIFSVIMYYAALLIK